MRYVSRVELMIVNRIYGSAERMGLHIHASNGNRKISRREIGQYDETVLYFSKNGGLTYLGKVLLCHGRGDELIQGYVLPGEADSILHSAEELALGLRSCNNLYGNISKNSNGSILDKTI